MDRAHVGWLDAVERPPCRVEASFRDTGDADAIGLVAAEHMERPGIFANVESHMAAAVPGEDENIPQRRRRRLGAERRPRECPQRQASLLY